MQKLITPKAVQLVYEKCTSQHGLFLRSLMKTINSKFRDLQQLIAEKLPIWYGILDKSC